MTSSPEQDSLKILEKHFRDKGAEHRVASGQKTDPSWAQPIITGIITGMLVLNGIFSVVSLGDEARTLSEKATPAAAFFLAAEPQRAGEFLSYRLPVEKQIQEALKISPGKKTEARLADWKEALHMAKKLNDPRAKILLVNWAANALFPYSYGKNKVTDQLLLAEKEAWDALRKEVSSQNLLRAAKASWHAGVLHKKRLQTPAETLAQGEGMCFDISVLKAEALIQSGLSPEDVGVLLMRHQDGSGHAVVIYRQNDRVMALNNLQEKPSRFFDAAAIARPQLLDELTQKNELGGWSPYQFISGTGRLFDINGEGGLKSLPSGLLRNLPEATPQNATSSDEQAVFYYMAYKTDPKTEAAPFQKDYLRQTLGITPRASRNSL